MTHSPQRVILIVEDFPSDGDLYRRCLLELGCRYTILENSLEGLLALSRSFAPQSLDCILLSSNGLKGLAQLNDQMGARCPPIVMIADDEDVTIAVQAIKQGAEDYLIRPKTTPDQLRLVVQTAIANAELKQKSQRSEKRFRTSVENMLDCFGIYSAIRDQIGQIIDFRIDYLNAVALESICLTVDDIGKSLCDVLPYHRESGQFAKYCQVVETGQPLIEKSLIYSDVFGNEHLTRVYDLHVSQLEDGFVAAWRDVTERKQSEAELRTLNERFKLAATAVKCLIYDWDLQTNIVTRPFGFTELLGYRPEEVEPTREWWQQCIHPDDANQLRDRYRINLETADRYTVEYRVRHHDGHYLWMQDQGVVLRDEANHPVRIVGTTIDIDDRKQAESALRRSQERLQHMVNTAQVGIAFASSTGEILEINHALLQMLGYSREEFLDQTLTWQAISLLESAPLEQASIEQLGTPGSTVKELIHKDGWRVPRTCHQLGRLE
jgi:PAS domain S-box-containing protein